MCIRDRGQTGCFPCRETGGLKNILPEGLGDDMRNEFSRQLNLLNREMTEMGNMCKTAIEQAMEALFAGDMNSAKNVILVEEQIDQKEKDIESLCMKLLLRQQPVASDLRTISAALKMTSDMERIGDQAEDIAEIVEYMEADAIPQEENLKSMAQRTVDMVILSIEAFVACDESMADVYKRQPI